MKVGIKSTSCDYDHGCLKKQRYNLFGHATIVLL